MTILLYSWNVKCFIILLFSKNLDRGVSRTPKHIEAAIRGVQKVLSQKFRKIHRKTPVSECHFYGAANLLKMKL